jgi:RNA polymerase sigma-32 factor
MNAAVADKTAAKTAKARKARAANLISVPARKRRSEILSVELENELVSKWFDHGDEKARERLILAYRPLALTAAIEAARQCGMETDDFAQEAYAALVDSLQRFDPTRGFRFGTFARWDVRGALSRHAMDFAGPCRLGTNLADKKLFMQFRKMRNAIEARTQRPLDDAGREEIAKACGVEISAVHRMEPRLSPKDWSIDAPISDADDGISGTRGERLVYDAPSPEQQVAAKRDAATLAKVLADVMGALSERERIILQARLAGDADADLSEIGARLGVSKERVRQIERRAIERLRDEMTKRGLRKEDFLVR